MKVATPKRVTRSYTQRLIAPPAAVFPLLCPVREADWIPGWDPSFVASGSGLAEDDCVFVTPGRSGLATWYVTRHEPRQGLLEIVRIEPEVTASRLVIEVAAAPGGATAVVTWTHTSLGTQGDAVVDGFTETEFTDAMQVWERRMNHYLTTGTCMAA